MKKSRLFAIAILSTLLTCSHTGSVSASSEAVEPVGTMDQTYCITGIIPEKQDTTYWSIVEEGLEEEAAANDLRLSIIYTESGTAALSIGLADAIDMARYAGADAIILSYMLTDEKADEALKNARNEGIKVVFVDRDTDESLRDAYVGIDNEKAGYELAMQALSEIDEGQNVLLLELPSYLERQNFQARVQGIKSAFADKPDRLFEYMTSEEEEIPRVREIREIFHQFENVGALICCSERMTIIGAQILETLGLSDSVLLYGFDRSEETESMLYAGQLQALIEQNNKQLGEKSIDAAISLIEGENETEFVYVDFEMVTKGTLEAEEE